MASTNNKMTYTDIVEDLHIHHITVTIYLITGDTPDWDKENSFPGHTTAPTASIKFPDKKASSTPYAKASKANEVRIVAVDANDEYVGAFSGNLRSPKATYGTIWVQKPYRAFQPKDVAWGMPQPYSLNMALHEIMDLLALDRGATTLTTDPQTPEGKVSAARSGFKAVGAAGQMQMELASRTPFFDQRTAYGKVMEKKIPKKGAKAGAGQGFLAGAANGAVGRKEEKEEGEDGKEKDDEDGEEGEEEQGAEGEEEQGEEGGEEEGEEGGEEEGEDEEEEDGEGEGEQEEGEEGAEEEDEE